MLAVERGSETGIPPRSDLSHALLRADAKNLKRPDYQRLIAEREKFSIVSPLIPLVDNMHGKTTYCFTLETGLNCEASVWCGDRKLPSPVKVNDFPMQQFEIDLIEDQNTRIIPESTSEGKHNTLEHIVAQNVDDFESMIDNGRSRRRAFRLPRAVSEVALGEYGVADTILFSSDGNIRILEYGNGDNKPSKVEGYVKGVRERYRSVTGKNLAPSRVIPYVVKYHFFDDNNLLTMDFYDPDQARMINAQIKPKAKK